MNSFNAKRMLVVVAGVVAFAGAALGIMSLFNAKRMLLALAGNLYPVPEGPYGKLPYIYLAYLVAGLGWFMVRARSKRISLASVENPLRRKY